MSSTGYLFYFLYGARNIGIVVTPYLLQVIFQKVAAKPNKMFPFNMVVSLGRRSLESVKASPSWMMYFRRVLCN